MKQLLVLILIIGAALGGWYGRDLIPKHAEEEHKEEHEAHAPFEIEDGALKLEDELEERLGIETSELKEVQRQPTATALGRVLDPAPLIALDHEITAAIAAAEISKAEAERAAELFKQGESVPKKNVVTAQAQSQTDQLKLDTLRSRLPIEWGQAVAKLDDAARRALVTKLGNGTSAIVRVEALEPLATSPLSVELTRLGDTQSFTSTNLVPAPAINERTQAAAFFVQCDQGLQPGSAITAQLQLKGDATKAVLVPPSAIVRQGPQAWVYVEKEEHEFMRLPVTLDQRVNVGWLVVPSDAVKPGTKVITTGAAALLSIELTAAGAGGGEEP